MESLQIDQVVPTITVNDGKSFFEGSSIRKETENSGLLSGSSLFQTKRDQMQQESTHLKNSIASKDKEILELKQLIGIREKQISRANQSKVLDRAKPLPASYASETTYNNYWKMGNKERSNDSRTLSLSKSKLYKPNALTKSTSKLPHSLLRKDTNLSLEK